MQETQLTITSLIHGLTDEDCTILCEYGAIQQTIIRKMFNRLADPQHLNSKDTTDNELFQQMQKEYSQKYELPVRVIKSCYVEAKAQRDAVIEGFDDRIEFLQQKITEIHKQIKKLKKKLKKKKLKGKEKNYIKKSLSYNLQALNETQHQLKRAEKKEIHRMWGTKEFYKSQWNTKNTTGDATQLAILHEEWLIEWRVKRNNRLYFVGSHEENFGNNLCQLKDLQHLQLRLPDNFKQKFLNLNVDFEHKNAKGEIKELSQYFIQARADGQPFTYRLFERDGRWYAQATFMLECECERKNQCSSIDVNYDMFATCDVKEDGNPEKFFDYWMDTENKSSEEIDQMLISIVHDLVDNAKTTNRHIAVDELDMKSMRKVKHSKQSNRKISMIAYRKFMQYLIAYATKQGVFVDKIPPQYTSVIAKVKYQRQLGRSNHDCASLVIGRRSLGYKEKIPHRFAFLLHSGESNSAERHRYLVKQFGGRWDVLFRRLKAVLPKGEKKRWKSFDIHKFPFPPDTEGTHNGIPLWVLPPSNLLHPSPIIG